MTTSWDAESYARNFSFVPQYGRELIGLLAPQKNEKILDLGCGTGALTAEIAALGAHVTGIDRDANMMAVAAKSYPGLTFRQQDAENLTVTGTFDAVFSNAALHWMDVGKVFPQLARVLRAGGRFVAELGGLHNIMTIERAIYDALAAMGLNPEKFPRPWRFPPPSELALKLEQAGFEVRYMHLYDRSTLLAAETGGIKGWVRMFGRAFLDKLPPDRQETFLGLIEDETRSSLYRDGQWYADYRRQHFIAAKL